MRTPHRFASAPILMRKTLSKHPPFRSFMTRRIILQWPSFGPYHTARLRACAELAPEGVEVVGLAVAGQVEGRPWKPDREMEGVRIVTLFPDAMYHALQGSQVAEAMTRTLDELEPFAVGVSGYGMTDSRAALRWCVRHGVRRVLMTESKADDAPRVWWKEWLKRRLVARFHSALCGGSPHRAYLEQLGMAREKIWDRYDVVDNERFHQAAEQARSRPEAYRALPGLDESSPYFLVSSRFIERKNLSRLIRAYAAYRTARPDGWRLVILGTGPDEAALRARVESERVAGVCFAGFQQFDELAAYYAFAGAFIHPALQEQWGLVVNEAMACGLPVLCSATVGAAHDLVRNGENGWRFDPTSTDEMRDAMLKVSADEETREKMGRRSIEIIAEWTPRHFAEGFWNAVGSTGDR